MTPYLLILNVNITTLIINIRFNNFSKVTFFHTKLATATLPFRKKSGWPRLPRNPSSCHDVGYDAEEVVTLHAGDSPEQPAPQQHREEPPSKCRPTFQRERYGTSGSGSSQFRKRKRGNDESDSEEENRDCLKFDIGEYHPEIKGVKRFPGAYGYVIKADNPGDEVYGLLPEAGDPE
ncbi:hypothetical protein BDZ91DRAFT_758765 [Kalaharituber pfeilii]|nr:hypothetical protein BDZ91DRAFT_758765 [Kalaharituber pfeilii]